MRTKLMSKELK